MPAAVLLVFAVGSAVADEAVVNISAVNPDASEAGPVNGVLIVTREAETLEEPLVVNLTFAGSAEAGSAYQALPASVTIEPYAAFAQFEVVPLADGVAEGAETVEIGLGEGGYRAGDDSRAEVTITDGAGEGSDEEVSEAPPAALSGTLSVSMVFEGSGQFSNKRDGTFSNVSHHHAFQYRVPLRGNYSPASGIAEIDAREVAEASGVPDFERFIIWGPAKMLAPPPRFCGSGKTRISDERTGKELNDSAQLVPFVETIIGGGDYPSLDKTVPEYDLCGVLTVFDTKKKLYYLRMEGADTNVRVISRHNGIPIPEYNEQVYGQSGDFRSKLIFTDQPITGDGTSVEGTKIYENFNEIAKTDPNNFPLRATIKWKVSQP